MSEEPTGKGKLLLEAAASEAKRLGRPHADLIALLVAVDRRADDGGEALDSVFGEGSAAALAAIARTEPPFGDEEAVRGFLGAEGEKPTRELLQALQEGWPELGPAMLGTGTGNGMATQPARPEREGRHEEEPGEQEEAGEELQESPRPDREPNPGHLADRLRGRLKGQEEAISQVVRRLAVTRQELDLRPERPDGVFLFVGPTGVGKTELAVALAEELHGDPDALVRLDMSEYAHDWAISRLTGPMPGYVGSGRPEAWLTTRVMKKPNAVVLLDEVEKAHPAVWNIFLQAFDAGRLTDSRGKTADFSRTVVVMTSNIGAEAFTKRGVGFVRESDRSQDEREANESSSVTGSVHSTLPPELINRLDAIVTFRALGDEEIREIAALDLARLVARMQDRGLELRLSAEVGDFIASANYDRRFGARHLQRNLELLLLEPLAMRGLTTGKVDVTVQGDELAFSEAS